MGWGHGLTWNFLTVINGSLDKTGCAMTNEIQRLSDRLLFKKSILKLLPSILSAHWKTKLQFTITAKPVGRSLLHVEAKFMIR